MRIGIDPHPPSAGGGFLRRHLGKFAGDVFPSVIATVAGAWIVTHYVNVKPAPLIERPAEAAAVVPKTKEPTVVPTAVAAAPPAQTVDRTQSVKTEPAAEATPEPMRVIPLRATQHGTPKTLEPPRKPAEQAKAVKHEPTRRRQEIVSEPLKPKAVAETAQPSAVAREPAEGARAETGREAESGEPATSAADAAAMARRALDRLKNAPPEPEVVVTSKDQGRVTDLPFDQAPIAGPAQREEASAMPPPLPPPVTVTEPSSGQFRQTEMASPQRALQPVDLAPPRPVRVRRNPDAPVPPADIPQGESSASPPGFVFIR